MGDRDRGDRGLGDRRPGDRGVGDAGRGRTVGAGPLPDELRALGRDLRIPPVDAETMVEQVLAGLVGEPVPKADPPGRGARLRAWARARWRSLMAAVCGLLVVLALTPPVRAAVTDWFALGGVKVRYDPSVTPTTGADPPCRAGRAPAPASARGTAPARDAVHRRVRAPSYRAGADRGQPVLPVLQQRLGRQAVGRPGAG
ncbi:hypothetical protein [Streptomyces sp. KR80]|uniref:hypothetical protein n=1 Tax=Streptomyces sp. KR80 TaxID=3457426 RepID=UPI003FD53DE0